MLLVLERREDDHLDAGVAFVNRIEARQPVQAREAQVEQHEIGVRAMDERQHLGAGLGLAHDLDVLRAAERPAYRFENQAMVVGNEDANLLHDACPIDRLTFAQVRAEFNGFFGGVEVVRRLLWSAFFPDRFRGAGVWRGAQSRTRTSSSTQIALKPSRHVIFLPSAYVRP